eukprot:Polyplicarium_translucidae@DN1453_c0_g1_i1.p1
MYRLRQPRNQASGSMHKQMESEKQTFAEGLRRIDMSPGCIQWLSSTMRGQSPDARIQSLMAWSSHMAHAPPQELLPLIYVANDVLQLTKQDEAGASFKNQFLMEMARHLCTVHARNSSIIPRTFRVLQIWRNRAVMDEHAADLLEAALEGRNTVDELQDYLEKQELRSVKQRASQGADALPEDSEFARKIVEAVERMEVVQNNISEKRKLSNKLEAAGGDNGMQIEVLLKKEWQLRLELAALQKQVLELLERRQGVIARRLGAGPENLDGGGFF